MVLKNEILFFCNATGSKGKRQSTRNACIYMYNIYIYIYTCIHFALKGNSRGCSNYSSAQRMQNIALQFVNSWLVYKRRGQWDNPKAVSPLRAIPNPLADVRRVAEGAVTVVRVVVAQAAVRSTAIVVVVGQGVVQSRASVVGRVATVVVGPVAWRGQWVIVVGRVETCPVRVVVVARVVRGRTVDRCSRSVAHRVVECTFDEFFEIF